MTPACTARRVPAAICAAAIVCCAILPQAAFAELSDESMVGPGVRTRPAYDGSDSRHGEWVPVVRHYGHPWFLRSTQGVLEGGLRATVAPGLHAGAQVAYEPGRAGRESDFLRSHGVPDVSGGASIGAHLEWDHRFGPVPVALLARVRRHVDADRGTQADFRLSVGVFQAGRFKAGVFTQAVWASAKSTDSFYGITPALSGSTGLPAFQAGSGWLNTSAGVLWSFDLSRKWIAVGNLEARRLTGDAADSPLVQRKSGYSAAAGIAYRF